MNQTFGERDRPFLESVSDMIQSDLNSLGFRIYPWPESLGHDELGLKIEKIDPIAWAVGSELPTGEKVDIHFDSVRLGALRFDVEVRPYKPGRAEGELRRLELQ